jgi:hypothetical protein
MMDRKPVTQGDVLLMPVDAVPEGAQLQAGRQHTLAFGEVTGHAHVLDRSELATVGVERYVTVGDGAAIRHEDHGPVIVPAGVYRVLQQTEPDLLGGFRAVAD